MNEAPSCSPSSPGAPVPAILVVEDDILIRAVTSDYLRESGFEVVEADTADEAVHILNTNVRIDLIFSDVNMPGQMDGYDLEIWVRAHYPQLGIILTSGLMRTSAPASGTGPQTLLVAKPYRHEELIIRIREMLGR